MNAPSSFDAATITIEAAVAATVALLMMVAVYREKENNETEIIFNDVIGKCHKCLKVNLIDFLQAEFHLMKTMSQPPCFDIEY
tara:strand:- start:259 stop:507 length:249 start_codon:yes stop_codon:yes gene_type:complete